MEAVQNAIHRLEVGGGIRYFRVGAVILGLLVLAGIYDLRCYQNMSTQEAMDAAQLGRNIAQGKGYTTSFVRPLSMSLLQQHNSEKLLSTPLGQERDPYRLKSSHPDLANPPAYPLFLAGLMKLPLFKYEIPSKPSAPWFKGGVFRIYEPDFVITVVNQLIFFAVLVLAFCLAKRLFDKTIAWTSALILAGTEVLWRFTNSGLSTMFLLLIFTLLVWTLVLIEEETREPKGGPGRLIGLGVAAGLLVGVGALTRYSFGWMIIPVVVFVAGVTGVRQAPATAVAVFLAFSLALAPWVARNLVQCGMPFGTATYSVMDVYPDHGFGRLLTDESTWSFAVIKTCLHKMILNTRQILGADLPRIGGSWVSAFFLVGLLVSPPAPNLRRLRYFLLGSLVLLVFAQALGPIQTSKDSVEINSGNLLILLAPFIAVFGVSFFYLLLEHIDLPFREARYVAICVFISIACLPLVLAILPPSVPSIVSPYHPLVIQQTTKLVKPGGLVISDIPWATAWYGGYDSLWLTMRVEPDLFDINRERPVEGLHLSRKALERIDSWDLSMSVLGGEVTWGLLSLKALEALGTDPDGRSWPKTIIPVVPRPNRPALVLPFRYLFKWPDQMLLTPSGVTGHQLELYTKGLGPVGEQWAKNNFLEVRKQGNNPP